MSDPGPQRFESEKKKARIEIIPLIDVIFFLLATFVLFTLSLEKLKSIPVNLPVAQPPTGNEKNDDDVTLQVSDGTNLYWNKELTSISDLDGKLDSYRRTVQNQRILIAGDEFATFGATIEVLDKIRKSGIGVDSVSVETNLRGTGK